MLPFLLGCRLDSKEGNENVSSSAIWQWSVPMDGYISPETGQNPEAFLWIPEDCSQVNGIIFTQNNMIEEGILEDALFRSKMRELNFAEIWVSPMFSQGFDFKSKDHQLFTDLINKLAQESGYAELATAPIVPLGHSSCATFPWNFGVAFPDRTLAIVSIHGDAPQTTLTGYGRENVDWGSRNIDGIPSLFVMGEYEWWEERILPGFEYQEKHPNSVITWLADAGHGHFDYSKMLIEYLANYIEKAADARIDERGLKSIDPQNGWLMDRWRKDSLLQAKAAPYLQYAGNRKVASWVFDEEQAQQTEAYYEQSRSKQHQYVGFYYEGSALKPTENHAGFSVSLQPKTALSFQLTAFYSDTTHLKPIASHSSSKLKIDKITGPVKKINDSTFQICFDKLGFENRKRRNDIWLLANNESDDHFKSVAQQINVRFPLKIDRIDSDEIFQNLSDTIYFESFTRQLVLNSKCKYYISKGPAFIQNERLLLSQIPKKARWPITVKVVGWYAEYRESLEVRYAEKEIKIMHLEK